MRRRKRGRSEERLKRKKKKTKIPSLIFIEMKFAKKQKTEINILNLRKYFLFYPTRSKAKKNHLEMTLWSLLTEKTLSDSSAQASDKSQLL